MDNPRVAIIILNWNGWKDTIECLESVYNNIYDNFEVIVVDNGSTDESITKIKEYAKCKIIVKSNFFESKQNYKPIEVLEYSEKDIDISIDKNTLEKRFILLKIENNCGFAEGNNIGIRFALKYINPNYFLLMSNDTIMDTRCLEKLIKCGEQNQKIGILGPKIYYYDQPNIIWSVGCKIDWILCRGVHIGYNELDRGQYEMPTEVQYINGSTLLIKTDVINKIGYINKKFFLYFEETDWCLRASGLGYKIICMPQSKIWHKISQTTGGIRKEVGLYYITRNRWLFMKKWANKGNYFIFAIIQILGAGFLPTFISVFYKNRKLFLSYYKGLWDGITSN